MSNIPMVTVNILNETNTAVSARNILLIGAGTAAVAEFIKQSPLTGVPAADAEVITALFNDSVSVSKVFYVRSNTANGLKEIVQEKEVWAIINLNSALNAEGIVTEMGTVKFMLFDMVRGAYAKPTYTNDRVVWYVGNAKDYATWVSVKLATTPFRTWANTKITNKPVESTIANLVTYQADNVIAFYINGDTYYMGAGKTSTGKNIDYFYTIDYIVEYLINQANTVLLANDKPTYDEKGLAVFETMSIEAMETLGDLGIIANKGRGYDYSVNVLSKEEQTTENKTVRRAVMTGTVVLAGSLEKFTLSVTLFEF